MKRIVVLLAALLAAAAAVQGSQATFTASATNPGSAFATAAKFPPVVTLTAPANGSYVTTTRPTLSGAAGNTSGDNNTITIKIYSGSTATGTPVQAPTTSRSLATWTKTLTTALTNGSTYTAVASQTDTSGNTGTSAASTFKVDRTKPTATSVSGDNKAGGAAGKLDAGDTLTFTYSEAIQPGSVWTGWSGSSAAVHIKFASSGNDTITVLTTGDASSINLGSVATNGDYVTTTTTFNATMAMSADGTQVIVTLGTPSNVASSANPGRNMSWTVGAGIKDLAGNTITTPATFSETGSDVDF